MPSLSPEMRAALRRGALMKRRDEIAEERRILDGERTTIEAELHAPSPPRPTVKVSLRLSNHVRSTRRQFAQVGEDMGQALNRLDDLEARAGTHTSRDSTLDTVEALVGTLLTKVSNLEDRVEGAESKLRTLNPTIRENRIRELGGGCSEPDDVEPFV